MNRKDVLKVIETERIKEEIRSRLYHEIREHIQSLNERVTMTPTGRTREVLTESVILFQHILDGKLLALPE
jgi:hypothetical protein